MRGSDAGRKIEIHFCPDCGTSVFWYAEWAPDLTGIAFGTFADSSMPWPTVSVWETTRHPWVAFDHQLDRFAAQPEIAARDLEQLIHGAVNDRTSAKPLLARDAAPLRFPEPAAGRRDADIRE